MVFLAVAVVVSALVAAAARRSAEAARAAAEAETLAGLAGSVVEPDPLPVLVDHLRRTFGLRGAALLRHTDDGWQVEAASGPSRRPCPAARTRPGRWAAAWCWRCGAAAWRPRTCACSTPSWPSWPRPSTGAGWAPRPPRPRRWPRPTSCAPPCSRPCRTTCAPRWPGIKASASSLRQPDIDWSDADRDEFLRTIEDETDRLTALVGNLLDMSRIQAGAVAPASRAVGLEEVVPAAVAGLGAARRRSWTSPCPSRCRRSTPIPPCWSGWSPTWWTTRWPTRPPTRRSGSRPARWATGCWSGWWTAGPGIPAAERERVFQPFQRTGDSTRSRGAGVGLGLAVARGFTRAMGGDLVVDDTPGGGTTMVLDLAVPGDRRTHGRVLVVDDEPPILRALGTNLRARDYTVDLAATGEEALALAAHHRPDAVILDLGLPGISGIEVVEGLRGWSSVPIIILSARGAEHDKVAALDAGADDYVTKPFGMDELLARLRAALRRNAPAPESALVETADFTVDLAAKKVRRPRRARSGSRPPSGAWSRCWCATRAGWCPSASCSRTCGAPSTARRPTTCGSTWPTSAASWSPTPPSPATSSPSPAWATASRVPAADPGSECSRAQGAHRSRGDGR